MKATSSLGVAVLSAALFFVMSGCAAMTVLERPVGVERVEKELNLTNGIRLVAWESDGVLFRGSGFRIEAEGKVIYIDPKDVIDPVPADYILITHSHEDHCSPVDIGRIMRDGTRIVCPESVRLDVPEENVVRVRPGDVIELDGLSVEAVPAYNFVHPRISGFVGYVLTVGGLRLYHAGDTGFIDEMRDLTDIDVAMVPIGMGFLAMDPVSAAEAVNTIGPSIAIPMHYKLEDGQAERFEELVDPNVRVESIELWQPVASLWP